jgi:hypothetical protein
MVLACYGPSLSSNCPTGEEGDLFTVSGAHDFLIEKGVIPRGHIECDPRSHKAAFLRKPDHRVSYMIASCCAPETFDALSGQDVNLWHSGQSDAEDREIARLGGEVIVVGGTTVSSRALSLGSMIGYRDFDIWGMDCSYGDSQHAGWHPNPAKAPDLTDVSLEGVVFKSSFQLLKAAQDFIWQAGQMRDSIFTLHGDGFLQHSCRLMDLPNVRVQ